MKHQHDLIVLDFFEAFDHVPHQRLLKKLGHYGIREWINAFLTHRTQQVTVEGAMSGSVEVLSVVTQGTVLGPLLFLVFINEISNCV